MNNLIQQVIGLIGASIGVITSSASLSVFGIGILLYARLNEIQEIANDFINNERHVIPFDVLSSEIKGAKNHLNSNGEILYNGLIISKKNGWEVYPIGNDVLLRREDEYIKLSTYVKDQYSLKNGINLNKGFK